MKNLGGSFDPEKIQHRLAELELESGRPDFWDNPEQAQKVLQEIALLKDQLEPILKIKTRLQEIREWVELLEEEFEDPKVLRELEQELRALSHQLDQLELKTFLSGEHDRSNAILELNAGAGGTEACDWVSMLLRMYLRWAESKGYQTEILDQVPGEQAGIKNITLRIEGPYAYGYLKGETGVHRLVRISPFDANKRRHTSFASVLVLPEIEEEEIFINPEDLKIETFRAGSAGGQHMQKNETAVRITHIPTGIVVSCQNERSQQQNKLAALRILRARLYEKQRQETEEKLAELRGEQRAIEWGNQIRSYIFQPYTLVKDHRTGVEVGDANAVMDGEIDIFLQAYLRLIGQPEKKTDARVQTLR